jgi:YfiH family protein
MSLFKQDKTLEVPHGFFGKVGGVSKGIFDSLNCGLGSSDDKQSVMKNRSIVANELSLNEEQLLTLNQIHSSKCIYVEELFDLTNKPEADAFVTDKSNILLGILTADCAPVLFSGRRPDSSKVIGAAHAGWKGAFGGILENTLHEMQELGAEISSISVCIGPCIQQKSYEISNEFYDVFIEQDSENKLFFKDGGKQNSKYFDLPGYIKNRLRKFKLHSVSAINDDTYELDQNYYSYRRTIHRNEEDYGRQVSVIKL